MPHFLGLINNTPLPEQIQIPEKLHIHIFFTCVLNIFKEPGEILYKEVLQHKISPIIVYIYMFFFLYMTLYFCTTGHDSSYISRDQAPIFIW